MGRNSIQNDHYVTFDCPGPRGPSGGVDTVRNPFTGPPEPGQHWAQCLCVNTCHMKTAMMPSEEAVVQKEASARRRRECQERRGYYYGIYPLLVSSLVDHPHNADPEAHNDIEC